MNAQRRDAINEFGKAVARQLNARRAHQGLTQIQLEEATGISQSQLSKQLRGLRAINMDELAQLCEALDVSMESIIELAMQEMAGNNVVPLQRRSNNTSSVVHPLPYAADSSDTEPEEGDDDYSDGP